MVRRDEILRLVNSRGYRPMTTEEMARRLKVPSTDLTELRRVLEEMQLEGQVVLAHRQRWSTPRQADMVVGRLQGNPAGFGFVAPADEEGPDVHIAADAMGAAMHNDVVLVSLARRQGRRSRFGRRLGPSGRVVRVLRRANDQLVGRFEAGGKGGHVAPDDPAIAHDVYVPPGATAGAAGGDMVLVRLTAWPQASMDAGPEGEIVRVLGREGDPGVDVQSVIIQFDLPDQFSPKAVREAEAVPADPTDQDRHGRRDLRRCLAVAIDPEDARDRDDALSLQWDERTGRRVVMVHIADVSHYVHTDSALDADAREHGCSVYLVSDFVPMLPRALTQENLSFVAGRDRLAKTVILEFDHDGELARSSICHTVVNVSHTLTYGEVRQMLDTLDARPRGDDVAEDVAQEAEAQPSAKHPQELLTLIAELDRLASQLKERRRKTGSVDLDVPDYEVQAGEDGHVVAVTQVERDRSHSLVEEFMLGANRAVAQFNAEKNLPSVYRVHDPPEPEELEHFAEFVLAAAGRKVAPHDRASIQALLADVAGTEMADTINMQLLRSMKLAVYAPQPRLHYALHFQPYCHFTSPIRRYPDLAVHQLLDQYFAGKLASDKVRHAWQEKLPLICRHCGRTERRAEEAEREIVKIKMLRYLKDKVGVRGQVFDAVITGVQPYGIFVRLKGYPAEGLVGARTLRDDVYRFDEKHQALVGAAKRRILSLGMPVRVTIESIDMSRRTMDLLLEG